MTVIEDRTGLGLARKLWVVAPFLVFFVVLFLLIKKRRAKRQKPS